MADVELDIQVRYHEVDQMGIAYHPRYFSWFEMARMRLLASLDLAYGDLVASGWQFPVVHTESRFRHPLRFGDSFRLESDLEVESPVRLRFRYRLLLEGRIACEARTEHAVVDGGTGRPRRLPPWMLERFAELPSRGGPRAPVREQDPIRSSLEA